MRRPLGVIYKDKRGSGSRTDLKGILFLDGVNWSSKLPELVEGCDGMSMG